MMTLSELANRINKPEVLEIVDIINTYVQQKF